MLKRPDLVAAFEMTEARKAPPEYFRNLKIAEAMYREARTLGAFPLKDPLEGVDVDIRVAKVLNVRTPP